MKRYFQLLCLSVLTLAIVDACSSGAERKLGGMMIDAGNAMAGASGHGAGGAGAGGGGVAGALQDAGQMLIDGGTALLDAAADSGSDAAAAGPANKSGSRIELHRITHTGADGTVSVDFYDTYYDTDLSSDCTPVPMSDGTSRCGPTASSAYLGGQNYWGDSGCTTTQLVMTTCTTYKFAYDFVTIAGTCASSAYKFFHLGSAFNGQAYSKSGANCTKITAPANYVFVELGAEIAPSELVKFTDTTETL